MICRSCSTARTPAVQAVRDEAGGLVVPLGVDAVAGVLETAAAAVVVLRRDEHIPVESRDCLGPSVGVRLGVAAGGRWGRFLESWQVGLDQFDLLEVGVSPPACLFGDPLGDWFAL